MKIFADRLRHARKLRGLTQAALAKACGLSQGAIANYERENRQSAKAIFKLASALKVDPEWLSEGTGEMEVAALPPPAAPHIAEPNRRMARWPFASIPPEAYWTLSANDRAIIERTVSALMASLPGKTKRP